MKNMRIVLLAALLIILFLLITDYLVPEDIKAQSTSSGTWQIIMVENLDQPIIRLNTETGKAYRLIKQKASKRTTSTISSKVNASTTIRVWWPIYEKGEYLKGK